MNSRGGRHRPPRFYSKGSCMEKKKDIWDKLYAEAKAVQNDRVISPFVEAGCVAAAIETKAGNIYTGICVDTASTLGICAERNAMFHMLTCGEHQMRRVVAVMPDGQVGMPCGACREFMMQLSPDAGAIEILASYPEKTTKTLEELIPNRWGESRYIPKEED